MSCSPTPPPLKKKSSERGGGGGDGDFKHNLNIICSNPRVLESNSQKTQGMVDFIRFSIKCACINSAFSNSNLSETHASQYCCWWHRWDLWNPDWWGCSPVRFGKCWCRRWCRKGQWHQKNESGSLTCITNK